LPTTRHLCNLEVWTLAQSCGNWHHSLLTPERVLSECNEDLIFLFPRQLQAWALTAGGRGTYSPLDFHTWYRYK